LKPTRGDSCNFADAAGSMFDAHHLRPLAVGARESRLDDLVVLCPTCHGWAHEGRGHTIADINR